MKRVNNSDINIKISPKIVNVTDCNLKFYTVNAENFYILKTNEDITTVERECNGHTFNEYYIKLLWNELITLGEGVLQFIVLNSSKHVERTTEYYIDSNVIVPEETGETYAQILAELETKIDDEIDRSVSADTALEEGKQDTLVSGVNIKTINNTSILGAGNIDIQGGGSFYTAGDGIDISNNVISVTGRVETSDFNAYSASTKETIDSKLDVTAYTPTDLSNYYTKSETSGKTELDTAFSGKLDVTAYTPTDLSDYYKKSETSGKTELSTAFEGKADTATTYTKTETDNAITAATSTKQDTLVSGTNIKTINNTSILGGGNIDIQGSGKAIEGGRGIIVTTGATADTVSFNLSISAGTGTNSIIEGANTTASDDYSHAEGYGTKASGYCSHAEGRLTTASGDDSHAEGYGTKASGKQSHAEGDNTIASGNYSHAEGYYTKASGQYSHAEGQSTKASGDTSHAEGLLTTASGTSSHAEGYYTTASNQCEHASGQYNVSNKASTTFGNSGNTLFSVGNGTSDSARHNAFEIRQNGDIYIVSGSSNIKLQDNLGGGGGSVTVDSVISSTSTNALENRAIYNQFDGLKLQVITLSAYNALQNKDNNTLYIIEE